MNTSKRHHRDGVGKGLSIHQRRPACEFYWSILDPRKSGLGTRPTVEQLGYLFENELPCPIENLHAEFVTFKTDDGEIRVLACGCLRESVAHAQRSSAITFGPDALPPFLRTSLEPERINLLSREFESTAVRSLRKQIQWITAVSILLLATLVTMGLYRRAHVLNLEATHLTDVRTRLYTEVLGHDATAQLTSQPPELRLLAEWRELRQSRREIPTTSIDDATLALATLLRHWPVDSTSPPDQILPMQTDRLTVTPTAITIAGRLPSTDDAQRFATRLGPMDGWQFDQPQVTHSRGEVQLDLRLRRHDREDPNS